MSLTLGALGLMTLGTAQSSSRNDRNETRTIRRDVVISAVAETNVDAAKARVGDRFSARIDDSRDLPRGTRLYGRVDRVEQRDRRRPAVYLRFDEARLVNGSRVAIDAVLVDPRNDRRRDGRVEGKQNDRAKETTVIGGAIGGLVIGSTIRKPVEGAILGTILGGIAAETNEEWKANAALRSGQRIGVRFLRDARFTFRNDDRYNDRNDDRYDPYRRDDSRRDDDNRPGYRNDEARVFRGREELNYRRDFPLFRNGAVLLPVEETARLLNLRFDRESFDRDGYTLRGPRGEVRFRQEDRQIELDRRDDSDDRSRNDLSTAPVMIGRTLYAPLDLFSPLVNERLRTERNFRN